MSQGATQYMIDYRMAQAVETLEEARLLLERQLHRGAVNRAYYAMFYAVQALLIHKKLRTRKHSGAIGMFDLEFIKSGVFKREFSQWLHDAFDLRQKVDYGDLVKPDVEIATQVYQNAIEFVNEVKSYLSEHAGNGQPSWLPIARNS